MTDRSDLEEVAIRLARILGEDDCLLIGGLAVAAHGYVRATDHVDLVSRVRLDRVRRELKKHGINAKLTRGDPLEGEFPCVTGELGGIGFDILPPLVPLDWERAIELHVRGRGRLKVVGLNGLLRLKLRAHGPQDLVDAAMLLLLHPGERKQALDIAEAYGVSSTLERWLEDPRLKSRARRRAAARRTRKRKK